MITRLGSTFEFYQYFAHTWTHLCIQSHQILKKRHLRWVQIRMGANEGGGATERGCFSGGAIQELQLKKVQHNGNLLRHMHMGYIELLQDSFFGCRNI